MNHPIVSIIMPCYNQAIYLTEAVRSLQAQTIKDWECIIVNDGSTDDTNEIALQLCKEDKRVRYINKKNEGVSSARNAAIKIATGSYVQLLDSDDLLESKKLEISLDFYKQNLEPLIIFSSSRYFENNNPSAYQVFGRENQIAHVDLDRADTVQAQMQVLMTRNHCVISAPFYPMHLFRQLGLFDEKLKALEDWDFHLRCLKSGFKFHYLGNIPQSRTLIRLHDHSMMRNADHMNKSFDPFLRKNGLWKENGEPVRQSRIKKALRKIFPSALLKSTK